MILAIFSSVAQCNHVSEDNKWMRQLYFALFPLVTQSKYTALQLHESYEPDF